MNPNNGVGRPCIFYISEYAEDEVIELNPADEESLAAFLGYI
jgi:hypothetical protein